MRTKHNFVGLTRCTDCNTLRSASVNGGSYDKAGNNKRRQTASLAFVKNRGFLSRAKVHAKFSMPRALRHQRVKSPGSDCSRDLLVSIKRTKIVDISGGMNVKHFSFTCIKYLNKIASCIFLSQLIPWNHFFLKQKYRGVYDHQIINEKGGVLWWVKLERINNNFFNF